MNASPNFLWFLPGKPGKDIKKEKEKMMKYTLLLQNNASRQEWALTGLTEAEQTYLAYIFDGFKMPDDAQPGEYTGVLFRDGRDDTTYELNDVLLDTVCHTGEGDVLARDLRPEIFLLRYTEDAEVTFGYQYNTDYIYYQPNE